MIAAAESRTSCPPAPLSFCHSPRPYVYLCVDKGCSLSVSLCLSVSVSVSLCLSICLSLSVSLSLSLSLLS